LKDLSDEHGSEDMEIYVIHGKEIHTEDHPADGEYSKFFGLRKDSSVVEVVFDHAKF